MIQEFSESAFYQVDYPPLTSSHKKKSPSSITTIISQNDGSFISRQTSSLIEAKDPKNNSTIRLFRAPNEFQKRNPYNENNNNRKNWAGIDRSSIKWFIYFLFAILNTQNIELLSWNPKEQWHSIGKPQRIGIHSPLFCSFHSSYCAHKHSNLFDSLSIFLDPLKKANTEEYPYVIRK